MSRCKESLFQKGHANLYCLESQGHPGDHHFPNSPRPRSPLPHGPFNGSTQSFLLLLRAFRDGCHCKDVGGPECELCLHANRVLKEWGP